MRQIYRALALATAVALISQPAAAEQVLRLTLQLPITNILGQNAQAFKKIVERESGGEIKIEIYPSAQLYKDKEVPQAVASGAIEMGIASITRFAGTRPAVDLFYMPFLFNDNESITKATAPGHPIRVALDKEMLSTGARPLWWQPFGLAIMLGKEEPLAEPAALEGKKARVFGKMLGEFVKAAGGAPVLLSGSEQFIAYQRGTVDFGMTGVTAVKSRKLHEVMGYLTNTNHAAIEFVVLINDKVWSELGDGKRALLTKAALQVEQELRAGYGKLHQDTLDWVAGNTKMKVIDLTPAQVAAWRSKVKPVYDLYVAQTGATGRMLLEQAQKLQ